MFYVKDQRGSITKKIELHDDNVFTTCLACGKEIQVDLAEIFESTQADLYGVSVYCKGCCKRV